MAAGAAGDQSEGFLPLHHAQLLLDLEECIRENAQPPQALCHCLRVYARLLDPLAPPRAAKEASSALRESQLLRNENHQVAEHLFLAFGGGGSAVGADGRATCREAFLAYARVANEPDSRPRLLLHTRPHFFPPHLVADAPGPHGRRSLSDRVDFAVRLWLFDRQCALEAIERLLVHRAQLVAQRGAEAAAHNGLLICTNLRLVRGVGVRAAAASGPAVPSTPVP